MQGFTPQELIDYGARQQRLGKRFDARRPLPNARQEKCLQIYTDAITDGHGYITQERAYVLAGYAEKGARTNATRLMKRDRFRARYEYVMALKSAKTNKNTVTQSLWQALATAKMKGRPAAMLRAIKEMAVLHGLREP